MRRYRAILALALAVGGLLWCRHAFLMLAQARAAERIGIAAGAAPRITAARAIAGVDERGARGQLARLLGDRAAGAGVRLALAPDAHEPAGLVAVRMEADGPEPALRRFAAAVENGAGPMIRLLGWSIRAQGSGAHLAATALAAWSPPGRAAGPALRLPDAGTETVPETRALFAAASAPADAGAGGDVPALVGIAGRLPGDAVALLRLPDGSTRSLALGQSAGGWRLAGIAADRVQLARGQEVRVLVLPAQADAEKPSDEASSSPN